MEFSAISLIIVQGPRKGETLDFQPEATIRIGRVVRGNTFAIKDAGISTKHLSIEFDSVSGKKWVLRDLDSSNGTIVNDTKLPPHDAFPLTDGDVVKLGESSSILVRINSTDECRSRPNPRRKAEEKCAGSSAVESVVETRNRRKKAVEEVSVPGGGNIAPAVETGRCLRSRKGRGEKGEISNQVADCEKIEENLDVGRRLEDVKVGNKPSTTIATRSTRRTKNTASVATDSVLGNVPENSIVVAEVNAVAKKTRAGTRGRKKLVIEPPDCSASNTEQMSLGENTQVDNGESMKNVNVEETGGSGSCPKEVLDPNEKENVCIISESCEDVDDGRASHDEEFLCKAEKAPDLKKMKLGEWFDYLETHLPKQIIDATEEIISGTRIKSAQVRDYVSQQKIENGHGG